MLFRSVDARIHAKRLTHCDSLTTASYVSCAASIQVVVVVLISWEIFLDVIVEVVIVVVKVFLRNGGIQTTLFAHTLLRVFRESHVKFFVITLAEVEA